MGFTESNRLGDYTNVRGDEMDARQGTDMADGDSAKATIFSELEDLKVAAEAFGIQRIRDGSWFNEFVASCLRGYNTRIMDQGGAAYLRAKYPGLPADAVAEKLCELAEKYAGIAGGLSGATASAAVLSAGAALPAAMAGIMAEVLFTVRVQLRLVHDLHLVYGMPIDPEDPEDLMGVFATVYGVKAAELGGIAIKKFGPEVARAQLRRLLTGNTPMIKEAVRAVLGPRIAKKVTQGALIKTAVPIAGIAMSAAWNFGSTRLMGARVRHTVRVRAALREEALHLRTAMDLEPFVARAMLEGLLLLACADQDFDDKERSVYLALLSSLGLGDAELAQLEACISPSLEQVCASLNLVANDASKRAIGQIFCLIAAADASVDERETAVLTTLLAALHQQELLETLPALAKAYAREQGTMERALAGAGELAAQAGERASNAAGAAMGWMKSRFSKSAPEASMDDVQFAEAASERANAEFLRAMGELSLEFAEGRLDSHGFREAADALGARFQEESRAAA